MIKVIKSQKIENIRRKFHNHREWLLIAIDKIDKATTTPLTGRLIAHSPNREEIYKTSLSYKGLALVDYSEDKLPKDTALIFKAHA